MIVIEKNDGVKIAYDVINEKITFDDDLTINLTKREQDWSVHIDVCKGADGELVIGAAVGRAYIAEIDIPARKYVESQSTFEGEEQTVRTPVPLSMDDITLSLWTIE